MMKKIPRRKSGSPHLRTVAEMSEMKAVSQGKEVIPSCFSPTSRHRRQSSKCCNRAGELACNACILCVICPLSIVWCCIKLPCAAALRAAKHVIYRTCFSSEKKIFAAYSSFSDIDSPRKKTTQRVCSSAGRWVSK